MAEEIVKWSAKTEYFGRLSSQHLRRHSQRRENTEYYNVDQCCACVHPKFDPPESPCRYNYLPPDVDDLPRLTEPFSFTYKEGQWKPVIPLYDSYVPAPYGGTPDEFGVYQGGDLRPVSEVAPNGVRLHPGHWTNFLVHKGWAKVLAGTGTGPNLNYGQKLYELAPEYSMRSTSDGWADNRTVSYSPIADRKLESMEASFNPDSVKFLDPPPGTPESRKCFFSRKVEQPPEIEYYDVGNKDGKPSGTTEYVIDDQLTALSLFLDTEDEEVPIPGYSHSLYDGFYVPLRNSSLGPYGAVVPATSVPVSAFYWVPPELHSWSYGDITGNLAFIAGAAAKINGSTTYPWSSRRVTGKRMQSWSQIRHEWSETWDLESPPSQVREVIPVVEAVGEHICCSIGTYGYRVAEIHEVEHTLKSIAPSSTRHGDYYNLNGELVENSFASSILESGGSQRNGIRIERYRRKSDGSIFFEKFPFGTDIKKVEGGYTWGSIPALYDTRVSVSYEKDDQVPAPYKQNDVVYDLQEYGPERSSGTINPSLPEDYPGSPKYNLNWRDESYRLWLALGNSRPLYVNTQWYPTTLHNQLESRLFYVYSKVGSRPDDWDVGNEVRIPWQELEFLEELAMPAFFKADWEEAALSFSRVKPIQSSGLWYGNGPNPYGASSPYPGAIGLPIIHDATGGVTKFNFWPGPYGGLVPYPTNMSFYSYYGPVPDFTITGSSTDGIFKRIRGEVFANPAEPVTITWRNRTTDFKATCCNKVRLLTEHKNAFGINDSSSDFALPIFSPQNTGHCTVCVSPVDPEEDDEGS